MSHDQTSREHYDSSADLWLREIFASKAAIEGGVVQRYARDMERLLGRQQFEYEIRRRGFQAIQNAGQIVIFCNSEPLTQIG